MLGQVSGLSKFLGRTNIGPLAALAPDEGNDQLQESSGMMHLSGRLKPRVGWLMSTMEQHGRRLIPATELTKRQAVVADENRHLMVADENWD
jgi:hypothetical protein